MPRHGCEVIDIHKLRGETVTFLIVDEVNYGGKLMNADVVEAMMRREKERRLMIRNALVS